MNRGFLSATVLLSALLASPALGDEEAPADGMPLCQIIQSLEKAGYSRISEIVFKGGTWKIEAYKSGDRRLLRVDPRSAAVKSDKKDDD
jgi:hypothetical protein